MVETRAACRSAIERFRAFVQGQTFADTDASVAVARLKTLEQKWNRLETVHYELVVAAVTDAEREAHDAYIAQCEIIYADVHAALERKIHTREVDDRERLEIRLAAQRIAAQQPQRQQPLNVTISSSDLLVEKSKLGTFDGDLTKWFEFHDSFVTKVHNKERYDNVHKLHLLKQALVGNAAKILENWPSQANSYASAWDRVKAVHRDEYQIVHAHLDTLFRLPVLAAETYAGLRQLIDTVMSVTRVLTSLDIDVSSWDTILIYIVVTRLPKESRCEWEQHRNIDQLPKFSELENFLERRAQCASAAESFKSDDTGPAQPSSSSTANNLPPCPHCKGKHGLYACKLFREIKQRKQRIDRLNEIRACHNCLKVGHFVANCPLSRNCARCGQRHNVLICNQAPQSTQATVKSPQVHAITVENDENDITYDDDDIDADDKTVGVNTVLLDKKTATSRPDNDSIDCNNKIPIIRSNSNVILATAVVTLHSNGGFDINARALCDSGSQANLISLACVEKLGLKRRPYDGAIAGVTLQKNNQVRGIVTVAVSPRFESEFSLNIEFLVVNRIVNSLPTHRIPESAAIERITADKRMADPKFAVPEKIDLLLGAEVWGKTLMPGLHVSDDHPTIQQTRFGWIVFGGPPLPSANRSSPICAHLSVDAIDNDALDRRLNTFWETEELQRIKHQTSEEKYCENFFVETHQRQADGRYMIRIPIRPDAPQLGDSYSMAKASFLNLEKRLAKDPRQSEHFHKFMQEYIDMGHMTEAHGPAPAHRVIIPQFPVRNAKKYRVVFDGSRKTSSGHCVNDIQMVGERLQDTLFMILIRFRMSPIAVTADIQKMYRQVLIHPDDRDFQRIVYRQ